MNWTQIHNQIIERAKGRILNGYSEKHHIIPKCLGGTNDSNNLVSLTGREHFIIHKLLCLIYPHKSKLHWAVFMMANGKGNKKQDRSYRISSREYQRLKESLIHLPESIEQMRVANTGNKYRVGTTHSVESKEIISKKAKGRVSPRKGKTLSNETKEKLSISAKGKKRNPHTNETKQKMHKTWLDKKNSGYESPIKGIPRNKETKIKISKSKTGVKRSKFSDEWLSNLSKSLKGKANGKIWINDGNMSTMINPNDGIPSGWVRGMCKKNKKN